MTRFGSEVWRRLAFHEGGHAVAALLLGAEVAYVELRQADGIGVTWTRSGDPWIDAQIAMAGWAVTPLHRWDHDVRQAAAHVGRDRVHEAGDAARRLLTPHWGLDGPVVAVAEALLAADGRLDGPDLRLIVADLISQPSSGSAPADCPARTR